MLMKKHSNPARALRYALVLPLTVLFVLLFQKAPVLAREVNKAYTGGSPDPISIEMLIEQPKSFLLSTDCHKAPEYPGGMQALADFISKNLKYPDPVAGQLHEGTVVVSFTVKADGYLQDVHLTELQDASTRMPAAYEAEGLRVISMLPKWTPGQKDCKPAAYELCIPIQFKSDTKSASSNTDGEIKELSKDATPPMFPGGDAALMEYLSKNIQFPALPKDTQTGTLVIIKFAIEQDGTIANVEAVKGTIAVDERLTNEALRVVKGMPKWTPAMKDGKPMIVTFTLPIRFEMQ